MTTPNPLLPDLGSPAQAIFDLCAKANSLFSGSNESEILACLRILDAQGLIDWRTPLVNGQPLLTALALTGKVPEGLMGWMDVHHGPELAELLTQGKEPRQSAHALIWRTRLADLKADNSGYGREGPKVTTLTDWVNRLPVDALAWRDVPGDTPGAGWLASALKHNQIEVAQALADRGVPWTAQHKGLPVALHLRTSEQWDEFLAQAGNPRTTGLFSDQPDLPLWEALTRRNTTEMTLLNRILEWAHENGEPQAAEAAYWARLRRVTDNGDAIKEKLMARPDWETARDHRGLPALWVAAQRSPTLLRLVTERQDRKGIFTARDHQGRGFWFHCSFLLSDRTFTNKLAGELRQKAPVLDTTLDAEKRGLVVQWLTQRTGGRWFPNFEQASSESPGIKLLESWPLPLLWAGSPDDQQAIARTLLENPNADTVNLMSWMLSTHVFSREKQRERRQSSPVPTSELVLSWEVEDLIQDCCPELRMALALSAVLAYIPKTYRREKSVNVFTQALEHAGMAWPAGVSPGPWLQGVERMVKDQQRQQHSSLFDAPLARNWAQRVRTWQQAAQLTQVLPDPAYRPRTRM